MIDNNNIWNAPSRQINGSVVLYSSTTLNKVGEEVNIYTTCCNNPGISCVVKSRNLLKHTYPQEPYTTRGVTFTFNEDGSVTAIGTATGGNAIYSFTEGIQAKANESYHLWYFESAETPEGALEGAEMRGTLKDAEGNTIQYILSGEVLIPQDCFIHPYLVIMNGTTVNQTFYPMVQYITDDKINYNYTPYQEVENTKLIINDNYIYTVNSDGSVDNINIFMQMHIKTDTPDTVIYFTYNGYDIAGEYNANDYLISYTIEKVGDNTKFFGFGICQKMNMHIIGKNNPYPVKANDMLLPIINTIDGDVTITSTTFYVTEVHTDETTGELSVTAYDILYGANNRTFAELLLDEQYTLLDVVTECARVIGATTFVLFDEEPFNLSFASGANLDGTETLREILNYIAEATQSIYFISSANILIFKRLDKDGEPVLTITKEDYFTLDSKTNRRLSAIVSATELGDNIGASLDASGTTQYIRNNPFWELREDLPQLIENALSIVGGFTLNQFECAWRGNPGLEIGDKIALETKDDTTVYSYVLNDTLEYNGGLTQNTSWIYEDSGESETNPTSLGEALKKTYARVDKANREIEIVAAETTALRLDAEQISATVADLESEVSTKVSAKEASIIVKNELINGTGKVTTTTGYTFDNEGLKISKTDSEIATTITEDGMQINKDGAIVLTADNKGVKAIDLHATTYLIVGDNSRFEDYKGNRTACFWIG